MRGSFQVPNHAGITWPSPQQAPVRWLLHKTLPLHHGSRESPFTQLGKLSKMSTSLDLFSVACLQKKKKKKTPCRLSIQQEDASQVAFTKFTSSKELLNIHLSFLYVGDLQCPRPLANKVSPPHSPMGYSPHPFACA